jgi:urea carboxylase
VLTEVAFPDRCKSKPAVTTGSEVPPYYDPMVAKIIVTRATALMPWPKAIKRHWTTTRVGGIETNLALPAHRWRRARSLCKGAMVTR